jgi:hypothetical protein
MLFAPLPSDPSYLDPVSSGAILQVLLAIFLTISLFIRAFWRKINSLFIQIKEKLTKEKDFSSTTEIKKNAD